MNALELFNKKQNKLRTKFNSTKKAVFKDDALIYI